MTLLLHTCCGPCLTYSAETLGKKFSNLSVFAYNPNIHPEPEHETRMHTLLQFADQQIIEIIRPEPDPSEYYKAIASEQENGRGAGPLEKSQFPEKLASGIQQLITGVLERSPASGRCARCYTLRLARTALEARDRGADAFSTTLLISPYQDHATIRRIGEQLAKAYNIEFYYEDLRAGFHRSVQMAKDLGLYRQNYCGCKYSYFERFGTFP